MTSILLCITVVRFLARTVVQPCSHERKGETVFTALLKQIQKFAIKYCAATVVHRNILLFSCKSANVVNQRSSQTT